MNDPGFFSKNKTKVSLKQALLFILLSTLMISGVSWSAWIYYRHVTIKQRNNPEYHIVAVFQTSPDSEGLKTGYLTELLGLSVDSPKNLYEFNVKEAEEKLLACSAIKEAKITKIRPGTLHVDYSLRKPVAYLGDYTNTAIDEEGVIFCFKPFYTPKKLPEIYFGSDDEMADVQWGTPLEGRKKRLAFDLLNNLSDYCDQYSYLLSIDVTNAFAQSDGKREIVISLEDQFLRVIEGQTVLCIYPRILRLRQNNYRAQLGNYISLRSYLRKQSLQIPVSSKASVQRLGEVVIDLRLSDLAFISNESVDS